MLYKANPTDEIPAPLEGQPHPDDTARAVDAIRDLLLKEHESLPVPAPHTHNTRAESAADSNEAPAASRVQRLRRPPAGSGKAPASTSARAPLRWQPDWRVSLSILIVASLIWNPWFLPGLALMVCAVSAIIYFSLGPDRVSQGIARWHRRVQRRDPDRAEYLRAWANRMSARLERMAGRLPARWTNGLYFPTFDDTEDDLDAAPNPFDRLVPQDRL